MKLNAPHKKSKNTKENIEPEFSPTKELYMLTLQPLPEDMFEEFEKSNEKLIFAEEIMDEDFLYDFYMDACNFDMEGCIKEYTKNIRRILTYIKNKPAIQRYTQEDWKEIYNYSPIDYSKPITYKYFKEILLKTPSLANLLYAVIDISSNIKSIEKLTKETMLPIQIKTKEIFGLIYSLRVEPDLEYCCNYSVLKLIDVFEMLSNPWNKCENLSKNYWFWIWMWLMLDANYFETFYEFKNLTKNYIRKCELSFWDGRLYGLEEKYKKIEKDEVIIDSKEENNQFWLNCRNVYNDLISIYQYLKFYSNQIQNKYCYEYIKFNYNRLILKNDTSHEIYISMLNNLFDCDKDCKSCNYRNKNNCNKINFNDVFNKFKSIIKEELSSTYEELEKNNASINIESFCNYFNSTTKQEYALSGLKEGKLNLKDISDKTILNKISNIEYELKHNKFKGIDFEKYLQEIEQLEKYEQIKHFLIEVAQGIGRVIQVNNSCAYNNLFKNLEKLESLTKKSQEKN